MQIKDLKPNRKNPRKISGKKLEALQKSLAKFGDLSGFVYNRRTKTLVSGHQRQKSLPPDATIKIEVKHDQPTPARTVAEGYVDIGGERFKYREVDADETWEMEALLAANKHGGEWDTDLLRVAIAETPGINIELAGFDIPELKAFSIEVPKIEIATPVLQQKPVVEQEEEEETDEEYVKNTPQTEETIPSIAQELNSGNPFDAVEEVSEAPGRRYVIIIDCGSNEKKYALRDKILPIIEENGCKIF